MNATISEFYPKTNDKNDPNLRSFSPSRISVSCLFFISFFAQNDDLSSLSDEIRDFEEQFQQLPDFALE